MIENPPISEVMTPNPRTIAHDELMWKAKSTMDNLDIHHLIVLMGDRLLGIVSARDLQLAYQLDWQQENKALTVGEVCKRETFALSFSPSTKLDEVLEKMVQNHLNAVAITESGKVVGIYTTVDACKQFGNALRAKSLV